MLEKLYERLREKTKEKNSIKDDSIFISFEKPTNRTRESILKDAAIGKDYIDTDVAQNLEQKNLIREVEKKYFLTARGVWAVERSKGNLNDEKIIEHFDQRKFDVIEGTTLSKTDIDRRKTAFLAMIAGRCFSKEASMDLDDDSKAETWEEITNECYSLLKELDLFDSSLNRDDLYFRGNKAKVEGIIRRAKPSSAPDNIFKSKSNGKKYYLDVVENGEIQTEKLQKIFRIIVGDNTITYTEKKKIKNFCSNIANSKSIYLYDSATDDFSSPLYAKKIRKSLMEY